MRGLRWDKTELSDNAENIVFAEKLVGFLVKLDFGTTILADEDLVADFDLKRNVVTVVVFLASAENNNSCFLRFFLSGVGYDYPALDLLVIIDGLDEDAITQWSDFWFSHFLLVLGLT